MTIFMSLFLFVFLVVMISVAGLRFWVRPKEAMERVSGVSIDPREHAGPHPSLVFADLMKKLGNVIPSNPKDANTMQRRLIRAGFRGENALKTLYGAKLVFAILLPLIMLLVVAHSGTEQANKVMAVLAAVAAGFFGPNEYVKRVSQRRQKQIQRGLSNSLDLMVVCVESGLGLDQAIMQVAKELEHAHPEISEEFSLVNLELKAGKRRIEALRNLAERTGVNDLKKLVAVLIQADRFGTGVAAEPSRARGLHARPGPADCRGEGRQARREADFPDLFLYLAHAVCGYCRPGGREDCSGIDPDDDVDLAGWVGVVA